MDLKMMLIVGVIISVFQVVAIVLKFAKVAFIANISWGWVLSPLLVIACIIGFVWFIMSSFKM